MVGGTTAFRKAVTPFLLVRSGGQGLLTSHPKIMRDTTMDDETSDEGGNSAGPSNGENRRIGANVQITPGSWTITAVHAVLIASDRLQAVLLATIGTADKSDQRFGGTQLGEIG